MVAPNIIVDSYQTQQSRIAVEDQYGTMPASPTWLRMADMRMVPKGQFETENVFGAGDELPSASVVNDDFTNVDVIGKASYVGGMYQAACLFGYPDSTLVEGSTYDHVYTLDGRTPVAPASYVLSYGLAGRFSRVLGFLFNTLGIGVQRSGLDFNSSGFGKAIVRDPTTAMGGMTLERQTLTVTGAPTAFAPHLTFRGRTAIGASQATYTAAQIQALLESIATLGLGSVVVAGGPLPTTPITVDFIGRYGGVNVSLLSTAGTTFTAGTSPTFTVAETTPGADAATQLPNVPMFPLHFSAYLDDTWAALGTTQMLALYNAQFNVAERWLRSRPVNASMSSDGVYNPENQAHGLNLQVGVDATEKAFMAAIRAGTMKFVRLLGIGPLTGDGTRHYEFEANACLIFTGTSGFDTATGLHVATWNTAIARDPTTGNGLTVRFRNRRSGL